MKRENIALSIPKRTQRGLEIKDGSKWLKASELKWETDTLLCAAQEQALTNALKMALITTRVSSMQVV